MLDIGGLELALIAVIALIVIGPKDLPRVLRTLGRWVGKARAMSREFQSSMDEMIREADLQEARDAARRVRDFDVKDELERSVDPRGELRRELANPLGGDEASKPRPAAQADAPATPAENAGAAKPPAPTSAPDADKSGS